jgi:lipoprotein-releasing system ATP-binding protein
VLDRVSLAIEPGEALAVTGPSGSGKSTLLHILGTLDRPTSGGVAFDGADPFRLDERELAAFRNRRIGFVFQDHCLLPQLSVLENVLVPTLVAAAGRDHAARARALLDRVGLGSRLAHRPAALSGGERQRVAIARALVLGPDVVLCDEPTGNLDRRTAADVGSMLLELARDQQAILVAVTHSVELADRFSRRARLDDGRLSPA